MYLWGQASTDTFGEVCHAVWGHTWSAKAEESLSAIALGLGRVTSPGQSAGLGQIGQPLLLPVGAGRGSGEQSPGSRRAPQSAGPGLTSPGGAQQQ